MFLPTKAHKQEISAGQKRLRIGSRAPLGAVNLAYSHVPALTPSQNIQIADTSGFILENIQAADVADVYMYPDETHLLQAADGEVMIDAETFLLTNVFHKEQALFFAHRLEYPIYDKVGPDTFGFYQGKTISLVDRSDKPVDPSTYRIMTVISDTPNYYTVYVYTSFQTTASNAIRAIYTAYVSGKSVPGTQEQINPQPIFRPVNTIAGVLDPAAAMKQIYYRTNGSQFGSSKVYAPTMVIKDTRTPIFTTYRVYAKDENGVIVASTPWLSLYVYNRTSATPDELPGFLNSNMILEDGMTASDIVTEYTGKARNPRWTYYAENKSPRVTTSTATDGYGEVFAYTTDATGSVLVPDQYLVHTKGVNQTFSMSIWVMSADKSSRSKALSLEGFNLSADDGLTGLKQLNTADGWSLPGNFDATTWLVEVTLDTPFEGNIMVVNKTTNTYLEPTGDRLIVAYGTVQAGSFLIQGIATKQQRTFRPAYKIRLTGSRQIKPLMPREQRSIESWYPRIQNGKFLVKTYDNKGQAIAYSYMLPEYFRQPFDPDYGVPYMEVKNEVPKVTGDHRVKVTFTPLFIDYDPATGLIHNVSIKVNGLPAKVISWDTADGSFKLDTSVKESDLIAVSYYYEESGFIYRGYYDEVLKKFMVLDLNPGYGHAYTKVLVDAGRDPIYGEVRDVPTFNLINETVYLYLKPTSLVQADGRVIPGTFNNSPLYHSFAPSSDPLDVLLAKIQVRPNSSQGSIQMMDTRTRGGGLLEEIGASIIEKICPDAKFYWDIGFWDGQPYQENAVIVIRLPKSLLKEVGGQFSRDEVNEVVEKHIAFGTFYIIDYIEESPLTIQTPENLLITQVSETSVDTLTIGKPTFTLTIVNAKP